MFVLLKTFCRRRLPGFVATVALCTLSVGAVSSVSAESMVEASKEPLKARSLEALVGVDTETRAAFEALYGATVFEDVAIGFSGKLSDNVRALRVIAKSKKVKDLFEALAREGTLVGKMYGTIGLYHLDRKAFDRAVVSLRKSGDKRVKAQFGCMFGEMSVGEILEDKTPQAIRLKEGESFHEWMTKHKTGALDIVGGGYSSSFVFSGKR